MAFGSRWTPPLRMRDREPGDIAFPISARRGTYSGGTSGRPIAKEACSQSMAYQTAAKSLGYCMRCDLKVEPLTGQLHFCHADEGKGVAIKTDVRRGWPGCPFCHEEVGRHMAKPVRRAVEFLLAAMTRQAIKDAGKWPKNLEEWPLALAVTA